MIDSKKIDDGGPAFAGGLFEPQHGGRNDREPWNHGMSLRDWFAGRAMQGQLSGFWQSEKPHGWSDEEIAAEAYRIADAMIAARKGGAA